MVRAAGLYPAGSRFESWLPYHPGPAAEPDDRSPGDLRRPRAVPLDQRLDLLDEVLSTLGGESTRRR
jgi:hypothetical protein